MPPILLLSHFITPNNFFRTICRTPSRAKASNMEPIQSWVSEHKLASVGALWASGIGATLLTYARTGSPKKPSVRLIHARMYAQALTLAVLSGGAAYHYYENRGGAAEAQPHAAEIRVAPPNVSEMVEWELHSPF